MKSNLADIKDFTPNEQDVLTEIVNIAMGKASASLAKILDTFVGLSVPQVRIVAINEVEGIISDIIGDDTDVIAVRQAFHSHPRGEALVIYDHIGCKCLADLMGYESEGFIEQEILLDVSNVLVGACLGGIAEQLGTVLNYTAPSILSEGTSVNHLFDLKDASWTHSMILEIQFRIEIKGMKCHLIIMTPEESIEMVRKQLQGFMDSLNLRHEC